MQKVLMKITQNKNKNSNIANIANNSNNSKGMKYNMIEYSWE